MTEIEEYNKAIILQIRDTFNQCANEAACMKMILDISIETRDKYFELRRSAAKIPVIEKLIGTIIEDTLMQWDDLVEDLTIASDPDIRAALLQISAAV
ncbi:MAG: hypothetical protein K9K21_12505 [Desulfotignum sp.]|nr:hypothetical protein [Desulfotignum sp.]MCF8114663.1 hypothetical protein [Desulfotignum sp.]